MTTILGNRIRPRSFRDSLARHLAGAGWVVFREIPLGSTWLKNAQRADVLALKKTYSTRAVIYECKELRSDFLRDVRNGKFEGYLAFCHQLYFAVHSGLVKKEEVPEGCGLVVCTENKGWHVVKAAQVRSVTLPQDLLLSLLFRGYEDFEDHRRLSDRVRLSENVSLADRAHGLGHEIRRRLRAEEDPDVKWAREAKVAIDQLLGRETESMMEATSALRSLMDRKLPGAANIEVALALVDIAHGLVAYPEVNINSTPWGAHARLEGILKRIPRGEKDDRGTQGK